MRYITRASERLLLETAKHFKALLLTGARQVGKSTLLSRLFPEYPAATLDDPLLRGQASGDPALFLLNHPAPVLLDEVQHAPEFFPHIKMACDRREERGRFLLTGSQPLRLMAHVSESLAGRVGIIELGGLSLREIQGCDFARRFLPRPEYLAARRPAPELLNFGNVADELGLSAATVRAWGSVLEASGIVLLLQPFSNSALNRAVKTPKIYFRDTGLACFLTRLASPETARAGAPAPSCACTRRPCI